MVAHNNAALGPNATSSDYDCMLPYWDMVETILEGAEAVKAAGESFLPQFPQETDKDYTYRRTNAKFTNIFADILSGLAEKPFSEEVAIDEASGERFAQLAEDIDGRGNNLHVFAANTFYNSIAYAIDWIFVDFTKARPNPDGRPLRLDQEKAQGLRPYWVRVPAKRMLAVYTDVIGGTEIFVHARMRETTTYREGFKEVYVQRVRVLNREPVFNEFGQIVDYSPATFQLYEQKDISVGRRQKTEWVVVDEGPVSIGVIPLVPMITGRRKEGSWVFVPPMQDAAYLQKEHYQQETALKSIKELTAFPMLAGNGVQPTIVDGKPAPVPVGPKSVLYAPPATGQVTAHGEWKFIEPNAESLKFLAADVENTEKQLRELGRQPLTAQTGNLTVVTTAFAAQKGNSAVQSWALRLKDALEQAFVLTSMWLNLPDTQSPTVRVFTDFALEINDDKGPDSLLTMRAKGDLSRETLHEEMQRRNILSPDFDHEEEEKRLEDEQPEPINANDIAAALVGGGRLTGGPQPPNNNNQPPKQQQKQPAAA